jgi:hypothetical protein
MPTIKPQGLLKFISGALGVLLEKAFGRGLFQPSV